MARNPGYQYTVSMVDRSGERASFSLGADDAAMDLATLPTALDDLFTAIDTVCDGQRISVNAVVSKRLSTNFTAGDGQREEKWLCSYHDSTTLASYQIEFPCRKATVKPPLGQDFVVLTEVPWANFKTKFEAAVFSPDGNAVVLDRVTLIGRNV